MIFFNNSDESPPLNNINEIMLHETLLARINFLCSISISCAILSPSNQELFSLPVS